MRDFDWNSFWKDSEAARREYVGAPITELMIQAAQGALGYRLPKTYIELLRSQNGGIPARTKLRTSQPTSWAVDHVAITGIYGLDANMPSSLTGKFGSKYWIREWGYPNIGIYFADCPSAGHDMLCLDYRECGPEGSPKVIHVDQELDYKITRIAENFEEFVLALMD